MSLFECWFDGCCEPRNPGGHAAWGAVIRRDGAILWSSGGYCGVGPHISNNVAEYAGVIGILERLGDAPGSVIIRGDSKLVIQQLSGAWRVKQGLYIPYYRKALALVNDRELRTGKIVFQWIPREQNSECDELSKRVLLDMGVKFKIQPEMVIQ